MKRSILFFLAVIMLLSVVSSFALAKTNLVVWAWGSYPARLQKIVAAFEAENPNIDVSVESVGWADMNTKMLAALASGSGGPDLAMVNSFTHVAHFASIGGLKDLSKYVEPMAKEYTDNGLNGASYKGRYFAIPSDVGPYVMFYRKSIFDKAGVKASDIVTWQDYIKAGKKIKSKTKVAMVPWPKDMYEMGNWFWDPMMRMAGGNIFDKAGNVVLDKLEVNYKVMQTLIDINKANIGLNVIPWQAPWNTAIKDGKVATVLAGAWFQASLKNVAPDTKGDWRIAPAPAFMPDVYGTFGGSSWIVPVFKSEEITNAAVAFAKFASASNKGVLTYGIIPAWQPIYKESYFKQPDPFFGDQVVWDVISDVSKKELATFNVNEFSNQVLGNPDSVINYNVNMVLTDQKTAKTIKQALTDAANESRKIIQQK